MEKLNFNSKPTENSSTTDDYSTLPIEAVDQFADILVTEYDNPQFRRWYCKIIYTFGPAQVDEWQARASNSGNPGKLFSKYASEALRKKQAYIRNVLNSEFDNE